jgi:hypothetical protein
MIIPNLGTNRAEAYGHSKWVPKWTSPAADEVLWRCEPKVSRALNRPRLQSTHAGDTTRSPISTWAAVQTKVTCGDEFPPRASCRGGVFQLLPRTQLSSAKDGSGLQTCDDRDRGSRPPYRPQGSSDCNGPEIPAKPFEPCGFCAGSVWAAPRPGGCWQPWRWAPPVIGRRSGSERRSEQRPLTDSWVPRASEFGGRCGVGLAGEGSCSGPGLLAAGPK